MVKKTKNKNKLKVGITGASGYTGYELIKILTKHSKVELVVLNSTHFAGKKVKELYLDYKGDEKFTNYSINEINNMGIALVFLALPATVSMQYAPKLKCKVIDLGPDYRYENPLLYEKTYKAMHADKGTKAVYGLPEINFGKIKNAKVVANPGCYATCSLLSVLPIKEIISYAIFDCKSSWSGAGKESAYAKDPSIIEHNLVPYDLAQHRHKSEIAQFLPCKASFTPHVVDAFQGILVTSHILLNKKISKEEIIQKFEKFYSNAAFTKIIKNKIPEMRDTQKTNYCHIGGFEIDENNRLVIVSTIDNLLKGASGQAVQNMNIMLGFDETEGLLMGVK